MQGLRIDEAAFIDVGCPIECSVVGGQVELKFANGSLSLYLEEEAFAKLMGIANKALEILDATPVEISVSLTVVPAA